MVLNPPTAHIKHLALTSKNCFALTLGPFQPNYGFVLGNMLRRIIFSRMPGAAITQVKIPHATHEYELLEYMADDLVIFLNRLKKVSLALPPDSVKQVLHIKLHGPMLFTAGQLAVQGIVVANPELVLTYIHQAIELDFIFTIELGYGYAPVVVQQPRDELLLDTPVIDGLSLHAIFNPIRAVNFTIHKTADQELIILNITTNGTIQPEQTVMFAFQYFYPQLELFRDIYRHLGQAERVHEHEQHDQPPAPEDLRESLTLAQLELTVRATNCLKILQIQSLAELLQYSPAQLLKAQGVGKKSLQEIVSALERYGLRLKAKQENI